MAIIGGEARRINGDGDMMVRVRSSPKETKPLYATAFGCVHGAVFGGAVGMIIAPLLARHYSLSRAQFARMLARDCSAVCAAVSGTESIMRGIRGKDDITNHLVAGSGAGLALSFLRQGFKLRPAPALFRAVGYAVVSGIIYEVRETTRSGNAQDAFYTEARAMLSKLGLEEYEKNFKKGHLTDSTLPLLTDSDLQKVNIPLGARLLILDHIKRYNKKVNGK